MFGIDAYSTTRILEVCDSRSGFDNGHCISM